MTKEQQAKYAEFAANRGQTNPAVAKAFMALERTGVLNGKSETEQMKLIKDWFAHLANPTKTA